MTVQEISDLWKEDEPKYNALGDLVSKFIKNNISEIEILPEISFRTKELLSIVKKIKKKQREKQYSYSDLNDKLGIRIICSFQDEMGLIDNFLHQHFNIKKVERKKDSIDIRTLDYISNHYDACINCAKTEFKKNKHLEHLIFEIQVRTLNQHAWANTAHTLSYKQEAEIPSVLMRKVYRLLSLYEIADDEFSLVNEALVNDPQTKVFNVLRKLEGKTYKYAQIDFDRETSLFAIGNILKYLQPNEIHKFQAEIDQFIKKNEKKIQNIFKENKNRFIEIPILTQPEIFLIWFSLEFFPYSITDNWSKNFDDEELEQIQTLWGKDI
jgi:ppGpp synthetase/RelA/SpoT-type nucleotidyltranferase